MNNQLKKKKITKYEQIRNCSIKSRIKLIKLRFIHKFQAKRFTKTKNPEDFLFISICIYINISGMVALGH